MDGLKGARRVTVPAMITAVSLLLMAISGAVDTGQLGTLVLLSLLPMILLTEGAWIPAAAAYGATLACGLLFVPDKVMVASYGLFFGCFGFAWQALQRLCRPWLRVLLAWLGFNVVWSLGLLLVRGFWSQMPYLWVFLAGQPAFFLYDYLFGACVRYYRTHFAARIGWLGRRG